MGGIWVLLLYKFNIGWKAAETVISAKHLATRRLSNIVSKDFLIETKSIFLQLIETSWRSLLKQIHAQELKEEWKIGQNVGKKLSKLLPNKLNKNWTSCSLHCASFVLHNKTNPFLYCTVTCNKTGFYTTTNYIYAETGPTWSTKTLF